MPVQETNSRTAGINLVVHAFPNVFFSMLPTNSVAVSGNGNWFYTQKLHVQMATIHRLPQSQTYTQTQPLLTF
jgi:hypothetical protein